VKTSRRRKQNWSAEHGLSRAYGTNSFTRNAVPGLKSWAKFRASLRDEDREPFSHSDRMNFQFATADENGISSGIFRTVSPLEI
jgi:hypothetical protein